MSDTYSISEFEKSRKLIVSLPFARRWRFSEKIEARIIERIWNDYLAANVRNGVYSLMMIGLLRAGRNEKEKVRAVTVHRD